MKFDVLSWMFNPFVLMFFAVVTGMLFGKIKFGKFNFGVSGTLFTGLAIGFVVLDKAKKVVEQNTASKAAIKAAGKLIKAQVVAKDFFFLFLILFVAAVGLLAAKDIGAVLKKYGVKFVALGFIITFLGASANYGMTLLINDSSPYEVAGVYTGALTSSPGLAAAIETAKDHSSHWVEDYENLPNEEKAKVLHLMDRKGELGLTPENTPSLTAEQKAEFVKMAEGGISIGHVIGYPFGVIIVILAMNFFPKLFRIDVRKEQEIFDREMEEARNAAGGKVIEETTFDLIAFCLACLVGYTIGKFKVVLPIIGDFSLGSTGGVLIGSLLLGYIGKIGFINFRMNSKVLGVVRQLALAFFLAVVGLRYGFMVVDALKGDGWMLAIVSLVVGIVAMLIGFLIGKNIFKINWIMLSGAICGGMTSTPGLGAAVDAVGSDDPAAGYGATYPFALLGMVLFTIILHKMPI